MDPSAELGRHLPEISRTMNSVFLEKSSQVVLRWDFQNIDLCLRSEEHGSSLTPAQEATQA